MTKQPPRWTPNRSLGEGDTGMVWGVAQTLRKKNRRSVQPYRFSQLRIIAAGPTAETTSSLVCAPATLWISHRGIYPEPRVQGALPLEMAVSG